MTNPRTLAWLKVTTAWVVSRERVHCRHRKKVLQGSLLLRVVVLRVVMSVCAVEV